MLRRPGIVLLSYICATVAASLAFMILIMLLFGVNSDWTVSEFFISAGFIAIAAALYAVPIAVPAILITEIKESGRWVFFLMAGLMLGVLLTFFLSGTVGGLQYDFALCMIVSAIAGAMTYWSIAWQLFPLDPSLSPKSKIKKSYSA